MAWEDVIWLNNETNIKNSEKTITQILKMGCEEIMKTFLNGFLRGETHYPSQLLKNTDDGKVMGCEDAMWLNNENNIKNTYEACNGTKT